MRWLTSFFRPTMPKLVFLAEWMAFLLLELAFGRLRGALTLMVAAWPLVLFYVAGCALALAVGRGARLAHGWRLPVSVVCLVAVDQAAKALAGTFLSQGTSLALIPNWLHLAHERNVLGSWVAMVLDLGVWGTVLASGMVVVILLTSTTCYGYYVNERRRSAYADAALVGLSAGAVAWACDMTLRGFVLDFVDLPGVVVTDLKDILLYLGTASLLAETLDNPAVSWRWRGWRAEARATAALAADVIRFAVREWRRIFRRIDQRAPTEEER